MQRPAHLAPAPFVVQTGGDGDGIGIRFDDGRQRRVQVTDAGKVALREFAAGQPTRRHVALQFRDALLDPEVVADGGGDGSRKGRQASQPRREKTAASGQSRFQESLGGSSRCHIRRFFLDRS